MTILLILGILYADYGLGDVISQDDLNLSFDVCYGNYPSSQFSLSDFNNSNTVFWINLAASW